jgi:predicted enzyme related to lactoylglutathione lyase
MQFSMLFWYGMLTLSVSVLSNARAESVEGVSIDKVTIAVTHPEEMAAFYSKTFGAELKSSDMQGMKFFSGKLGNIELLLCPKEVAGIKANENTIQLRFVVKDVDAAVKSALKNGGSKIGEIQTTGNIKGGAVRDPDGNSIELVQKS